MSSLYRILLLIAVVYAGYAILMAFFQRHLIYPGRNLVPAAIPSGIAAGAEQFWIITSFGKVEGRFIPARKTGPQPAVVYFHGNGELIDEMNPELDRLRKIGCGVLLVEYPGYGRSSGRPHQRSLDEAALAAYDMLLQRPEVDPLRVVSFGYSLGSVPAVTLAVKRPVRALILAAPLASLRPFARKRLLPSFLLHDSFDNARLIKEYAGPTLILHGKNDSIMPFDHGQQVAEAAQKGKLVPLDADHNDLLGAPGFWDAVNAFLLNEKIAVRPAQ